MKRTTITWPEDVAEAAEREAKRRGTSVSEVVREAVAKTLGCEPKKPRTLAFIGSFEGRSGFSAENLDEELDRTWADDIRESFTYKG